MASDSWDARFDQGREELARLLPHAPSAAEWDETLARLLQALGLSPGVLARLDDTAEELGVYPYEVLADFVNSSLDRLETYAALVSLEQDIADQAHGDGETP